MSGRFLSPDSVQGNMVGMNPYMYAGENPETMTDPTGQRDCVPNGDGIECGNPGGGGGGTYCYEGDCNGRGGSGNPCATESNAPGCPGYNPCAATGPQSYNSCTYHGGDCNDKTYNQCQKFHNEEKARKEAVDAERYFKNIANILGSDWLDGILFALGLALSAIDWWLAPIIGGIVSGLALAAGIIGNMAGDLADFFSGDATRMDRSGQIDYAWFTKANLEGDLPQIDGIVFGHSLSADGISLMGALVTFFSAAMRGSASAENATDAATTIMKTGLATVTVEVIAVATGAIILEQQADAYIYQEEADVV